jgi:hypothetical protein
VKSIFVKCFNCGAMLLQCGKRRFTLFFLNIVVVVLVAIVGEWGPVICMVKYVSTAFTLLFCIFVITESPSHRQLDLADFQLAGRLAAFASNSQH